MKTINNMKTAIQELIQLVEEMDRKNLKLTPQIMLNILEGKILVTEKEQILDAFNEGMRYGNSPLQTFDYPASRYYEFTYNEDKNLDYDSV